MAVSWPVFGRNRRMSPMEAGDGTAFVEAEGSDAVAATGRSATGLI
jgi:hypothetical protein